jgi:C4-dicarboxylate transporter DctM subunit
MTIFVICRINPEFGPSGPKTGLAERLKSLVGVIEAAIIFFLVIGGLYAGWFTPTEAGAVGVFFVFFATVPLGRLKLKGLINSIGETLKISCFVFMLVTGAIIFGRFLAVTRIPFMVADFAANLEVSRYVILAFVLVIYLIGGCFMDSLGFLVLTIPIFFPLGTALGFDPIWYSIILTMVTTMGAITPPVGVHLGTIFKSVSFFLMACIISLVILIIFPEIVLLIPEMTH